MKLFMETRKQNFRKLSLSELSFIIVSDNYSKEMQNQAYSEIKRRFSTNGCHYETFMEYEEEAVNKRGSDISNYLICPNPNGQQLMETYFKYVNGRGIHEHGDLLFSEVLLCNSNSQNSFFTKALRKELNNIKKRIEDSTSTKDDCEKLEMIWNILNERISKKQLIWYENSLTDCVINTVITSSSLMSPKRIEIIENMFKKLDEKKFGLSWIPMLIYSGLLNAEIIDYLNMHKIAHNDILRLSEQRKSIMSSLKKQDIDYSFVDPKVLIMKK